jgi:hypothetical protein
MNSLDAVRKEISALRMVVAVDSAMTLAVLRRMSAEQIALASRDFLQACEGLNIRTLFSELDEASLQAAQERRNWWIGLVAELVADSAEASARAPQAPATPGGDPGQGKLV